jgi:uncharacterized protein YdhG (YjbR/CyaY superfamily)
MYMPDENNTGVDEYIATFPDEVQAILKQVRQTILSILPTDTVQTISYGIPVFKVQRKPLVYFSGWKHHVSLHPVPKNEALRTEIAPYITGRGTIQFQLDKPIPYDLVKRIAEEHLRERMDS